MVYGGVVVLGGVVAVPVPVCDGCKLCRSIASRGCASDDSVCTFVLSPHRFHLIAKNMYGKQ